LPHQLPAHAGAAAGHDRDLVGECLHGLLLTLLCLAAFAMLAICASAMPYQSNDELPPAVANHLPAHAQDIFRREAFNHAWDESVTV
jgi:hypothetical protein